MHSSISRYNTYRTRHSNPLFININSTFVNLKGKFQMGSNFDCIYSEAAQFRVAQTASLHQMSDAARMRKPIKDNTPSFGKAGVESKRAAPVAVGSGKVQTDAERMRKPIKDSTPSFGRAGVESKRVDPAPASSAKPVSDSERMRVPIKNQTPSFGKAGVESKRTAAAPASGAKPISDSERMRQPIKNNTPSFGRADIK